MERTTTAFRAESPGRNGHHEARKKVHVRRRISLFGIAATFMLLLLIKVVISVFYLQSDSTPIPTVSLAMAEKSSPSEKVEKPKEVPSEKKTNALLRKREQELREKERRLIKREETLMPLKQEIDAKLEELDTLQMQLTAYAKKLADREKALNESKNGHLVALYTAMEPAKAAAIMDKLKMETVVTILRHMKGKSAGKIMAMMNPERGALVSEKLSRSD